jgi:NAD(P)-dependent dehydrogenase (short-subunit alcohol dehydrogenase family)
MASDDTRTLPRQHQDRQPGLQSEMVPRPKGEAAGYKAAGRLDGKIALITGGDSGIGRAVAVAFAKEGAKVAIVYLNEGDDAAETERLVRQAKTDFLGLMGDLGAHAFCLHVIQEVTTRFGGLDILVNNAGEQHVQEDFTKITPEQLERTFRTNFFSMFYLTQAAVPRMRPGSAIINSTSVTAYRGSPHLIDYSATKGAIVAFTRSLSQALVDKGIRVNAVAPGPIWTPLIPSTFSIDHVEKFGAKTPMGRPGQPDEVAPSYVFLASADSSYMTGQVLHPNGGEPVDS